MRFLKFLNEPYPYYFGKSSLWKFILIVFFFTFFFYFLFQPFEINRSEHIYNFLWTSGIHAMIPALVLIVLGYVLTATLDPEEKWKVKYEFIFFSVFLLLVGIGQFLIRDLIYFNNENWSVKYLLEEIRNTFLVGGIFICIAIPWNFSLLKNCNHKRAASLQAGKTAKQTRKVCRIETKVKAETFDLRLDTFLFARAEGNYLGIFIKEENQVNRILKRLSIRELQNQISDENVHQTHRSFLVNFDNIDKISGNAAGYKLTFDQVAESAWVSRSHIPIFENKLKMLASNKLNQQA